MHLLSAPLWTLRTQTWLCHQHSEPDLGCLQHPRNKLCVPFWLLHPPLISFLLSTLFSFTVSILSDSLCSWNWPPLWSVFLRAIIIIISSAGSFFLIVLKGKVSLLLRYNETNKTKQNKIKMTHYEQNMFLIDPKRRRGHMTLKGHMVCDRWVFLRTGELGKFPVLFQNVVGWS